MPLQATPGLLERDDELGTLAGAFEDARGGVGSVVLVAGEAGIGKSTLLQAWTRGLAHDDARVLIGWCDDLLTSRTLGPFRDVARTVGGDLAEAVRTADTGAVSEALLGLLADPLRTVVLVLEDVHWADEATLDVVRYVGRRIRALPALLVLSLRDDEVDADHPMTGVLAALRDTTVHRLGPRPLTRAGVAALLGEDGPDPDRVVAVTAGNPFFVSELARTRGEEVPATVTDAVLARARTLPASARGALARLAVMPGIVDRELAAAVVDDLTLLAPAERRGLLVTTPTTVQFRHELARRAVESGLTSIEQVAAHRRVLEVLRGRPEPDPLAMIHHAVRAGDGGVVADLGPAAVTEAVRAGAHRQAVALCAQVLQQADGLTPVVHAELLEQQAWGLYNLHDFTAATAAAEQAVGLRERLDDLTALVRALLTWSRMLYIANDPVRAHEALARAVGAADGVQDQELAAEVLMHQAQLLVLTDRTERAAEIVGPAVDAATRAHRDDLLALSLVYRGLARANAGASEQGLADLRRAVEVANAAGALEATARGWANLVEELLRAGEWDEAEQAIEQATAFYDDHDFVSHRYNTVSQLAMLLTWRGAWARADELFRELLRSVSRAGVLEALSLTGLARVAVWRGDADALELIDRAWPVAVTSGAAQYLTALGAVQVEFAWLHDRPELVDVALDRALLPAAPPQYLAHLLRTLQYAGIDPGVPVDADQFPEPYRSGLRGDWRGAARLWAARGARFPYAVELAASGEVEPMLEALGILDELGARPMTRLIRSRLRGLGVRSVPRGPQGATRGHPAGLTPRQVEVLALIGEGLTNAEIADRLVLSVRTVDHHVSAILGKLGVASRGEAVRAAAYASPI